MMKHVFVWSTTALLAVAPLSLSASEGGNISNLAQILGKGGPVMILLYILSFIGVCLVFYYLFTLRVDLLAPPDFLKRLEEAMADQDTEVLQGLCAEDSSLAARIVGAGADMARRTRKFSMIRGAVEDEGARQASLLWQKIQYLQDIAILSPMLGLLGTVLGMIKSFVGLQAESAIPKQTMITQGIAMALVTTAAGLVLGIIAMFVYAYFRGHVTRLVTELESRCDHVVLVMLSTGLEEE